MTTTQVHDERNMVINPNLKALSWGPNSKATSWNMYFVNIYKFHTKAWVDRKKTTNNGLYVKGVTDKGEDDFYDIIHHIYELEYFALVEQGALMISKSSFYLKDLLLCMCCLVDFELSSYDPSLFDSKSLSKVLFSKLCVNVS